jgi:hypothetical protein
MKNNPLVKQWIKNHQDFNMRINPILGKPHSECTGCGWPHDKHLMCGMGSEFGQVRLGDDTYYIDSSNVNYMVKFVEKLGSNSFHWKNEIFFKVEGGNVEVTHLRNYNNSPQVITWSIPLAEWESISKFVVSQHKE